MQSPAEPCSTAAVSVVAAASFQSAPFAAHPTSAPPSPRSGAAAEPHTPWCPILADSILLHVGERGFSFSAAAEEVGIGIQSLCRWRLQHPDFGLLLLNARRGYRTTRLAIILEAKMPDGRPDWRAAAWELEHAHPEDYSLNPKRRAAFEAARQAEAQTWERLQAEYRTFGTITFPSPAPAPQELQNPPAARKPHFGPAPRSLDRDRERREYQNALESLERDLYQRQSARPEPPHPGPAPSPEKFQNSPRPGAATPIHPFPAPEASPEKFQNSPTATNPTPASEPANLSVSSDLSPTAPHSPMAQKFQNPPAATPPAHAQKSQNPSSPGTPAPTELPEELRARYEQEIRDIEQAHADHLTAISSFTP